MTKTKSSKTYAQFYAHVHSKAHSPRSREVYLRWVDRLGEFYQSDGPGVRRLSERQVLDYLIYLRDDQKLAASTVNQALVPIRSSMVERLREFWKHHQNPDWLFPGVGRGWKQSGITQGEAMGRSKKPMSSSLPTSARAPSARSGLPDTTCTDGSASGSATPMTANANSCSSSPSI
jgi:hypothetical protein